MNNTFKICFFYFKGVEQFDSFVIIESQMQSVPFRGFNHNNYCVIFDSINFPCWSHDNGI